MNIKYLLTYRQDGEKGKKMKTYTINKVFDTQEECNKWELENLEDGGRKYNGEYVLMVMHESTVADDKVILTEIITV